MTALATVAGVVVAFGGLAFFGVAYVVSNIRFNVGQPMDRYRPTAAEARASATTVPLDTNACAALRPVYRSTGRVGAATFFAPGSNATAQGALVELSGLHLALQRAEPLVGRPLRARLDAADQHVHEAETVIEGWRGTVPKDTDSLLTDTRLNDIETDGYTDLRIAERLLGGACAGRLVPDGGTMMFGSAYAALLPTTTAPSGE